MAENNGGTPKKDENNDETPRKDEKQFDYLASSALAEKQEKTAQKQRNQNDSNRKNQNEHRQTIMSKRPVKPEYSELSEHTNLDPLLSDQVYDNKGADDSSASRGRSIEDPYLSNDYLIRLGAFYGVPLRLDTKPEYEIVQPKSNTCIRWKYPNGQPIYHMTKIETSD
jgi:hypothetical protein